MLTLAWWLPGLNGLVGDKPWALSFGELASFDLERCLGAYPVDLAAAWTPPDYWDAEDIALRYLSILMSGLMVAEKIFHLLGVSRLLVLVLFTCL